MPISISIINCSTRKNGRTSRLLEPFIEGILNSESARVHQYFLNEWELKCCEGCFSCWFNQPGKCKTNDDFTLNIHKIFESDILVLASPLWIGNGTHLFRIFTERLVSLLVPYFQKTGKSGLYGHKKLDNFKTKEVVLFSNCGLTGLHNFRPIIEQCLALEYLCDLNFSTSVLKDQALELKFSGEKEIKELFIEIKSLGFEMSSNFEKFKQKGHFLLKRLIESEKYNELCNKSFKEEFEKMKFKT